MTSARDLVAGYRDRFHELMRRFDVPGAVLALSLNGERASAVHGVTSLRTGVEVDEQTLFQIGSISKVYTATVALRLVNRGLLDLDEPVRTYLPDLALGDPETADRVTARHLLTHTSGIEGDVFTDTGRGDDCLARYVEGLGSAAQRQPLGMGFSYCNSGYVLLGHLLERLTGRTWDRLVADEVERPLGLRATVTLPEEALSFRTAMGHQPDGDGAMTTTPVWTYPRSLGPAGLICSTAGDLLSFAESHLADGASSADERLLPAEHAGLMRNPEVHVPFGWPGAAWGLGWIRYDWDGVPAVGHDGGTIGQRALVRLVPGRGTAVTVLTNSTTGALAARRVVREVMAELGLTVREMPATTGLRPDVTALARHVGVYGRLGETIEVALTGDRLSATVRSRVSDVVPPVRATVPLEAVDEHRFLVLNRGEPDFLLAFGGDGAQSDWLYNARMNHRLEGESG